MSKNQMFCQSDYNDYYYLFHLCMFLSDRKESINVFFLPVTYLTWWIDCCGLICPYVCVQHQGRHATSDEITACAYQAVNIDSKYNGAPVQVRVVMGKEPRHFLSIFKGKFIIFEVCLFFLGRL